MRQGSDNQFGRLVLIPEIRFAHAAAMRLLESSPPVVTIYGPAGTGKSHLVRHFSGLIRSQHPQLLISQLTASEFSLELARASQARTIWEFQANFRRQDVFICEDLQSLESRPQSQLQLLGILDALLASEARVLFTADRSPGQLPNLSPKLRNRLLGGVCVETQMPSASSRMLLLSQFAQDGGTALSEEIIHHVASSLMVSPRELRGALTQLVLASRKLQKPIDRQLTQWILKNAQGSRPPTLAQITRVVAKWFDVSPRELRSAGRIQGLVVPRQLAMFAAREWAHTPYGVIGRYFGRRTHSTIIHACHRIQQRIATDPDFRQVVQGLYDQIHGPAAAPTLSTTG